MKKIKSLILILVSMFTFGTLNAQTIKVELPKIDSITKTVSNISKQVEQSDFTKLKDVVAKQINSFQTDSMMNDIKGLVPDTTLPFYKQVYGDLKAAAVSIANGLGVAIKELFEILCIQQIVKSVVNTLFLIIAILFAVWCRRIFRNAEFNDLNFHGLLFILIGCSALFFFTYSMYHITETVTGFINPKFGAIKDITEMASQIKNGNGTCINCR